MCIGEGEVRNGGGRERKKQRKGEGERWKEVKERKGVEW